MSRPADARRAVPPGTPVGGAAPTGPAGGRPPTFGPSTPVTGIPAPSPSPETPPGGTASAGAGSSRTDSSGGSSGASSGGPSAANPSARAASASRPRRRPADPTADFSTPIPPPTGGSGSTPPPYTLGRRLADWRRARADGRAGLPGVDPGRPPGTPTLEELAQDFLARSHRERLRLDVELTPLLESEAALVVRIEQTELAADRAEQRLAAWPLLLDEDQLGLRRGGETRTADDVVRARRAREYEALRRPLAEEVDRLRRTAAATHEELARTRAAVRAREVVGATRVRRLHAQAMRRISAYERHLVRHHPAGDRVGPVLARQHPRIPGWVFDAEDPAVPPGAAMSTPPAGTAAPHTGTAPPHTGTAGQGPSTEDPTGHTGRHASPAEEA